MNVLILSRNKLLIEMITINMDKRKEVAIGKQIKSTLM